MQITVSLQKWNQIVSQFQKCEHDLQKQEREILHLCRELDHSEDVVMCRIGKNLGKERNSLEQKIKQVRVFGDILTKIQELYCNTEEIILEMGEPIPKWFSENSDVHDLEKLTNLVTQIFDTRES